METKVLVVAADAGARRKYLDAVVGAGAAFPPYPPLGFFVAVPPAELPREAATGAASAYAIG